MIFKKKNTDSSLTSSVDSAAGSHENTRILAIVAEDYLKEKRSKRRWGMLLKGLIAAYLLAVVWMMVKGSGAAGGLNLKAPHVAVVQIEGTIGKDPSSKAPRINAALRKAFKNDLAKGVILKSNSPGGTPVDSDEVYKEIKRLRAEYPEKKVIAVMGNICASGCYYIAAAADEIYANPSSIVGSIGVRMGSFGFVDTMKKFGVERRVIAAGSNKAMLDPFSPSDPEQTKHAEKMIATVHQQFINAVKNGRGERLKETSDMFSGLFWSGEQAKTLGLVDEFGDSRHVAREVFGLEKLASYTIKDDILNRWSRKLGASAASGFMNEIMLTTDGYY